MRNDKAVIAALRAKVAQLELDLMLARTDLLLLPSRIEKTRQHNERAGDARAVAMHKARQLAMASGQVIKV